MSSLLILPDTAPLISRLGSRQGCQVIAGGLAWAREAETGRGIPGRQNNEHKILEGIVLLVLHKGRHKTKIGEWFDRMKGVVGGREGRALLE